MVNLISPGNNKTTPASAEPSRSTPLQGTTARSTNATVPNETTTANKTQQITIQWAKVESNTALNTQQKAQLPQTNPELAKQLISQIKTEVQGAKAQTLTPQNTALLQQSPLHLLKLRTDDSLVRLVTPSNINTALSANTSHTATQLPLVKTQTGWQLATVNQLRGALQDAAAQLLKQNLPVQTPTTPLFKLAHTVSTNHQTMLANLPKTHAQVQSLNTQIINDLKTQNTQALSRELNTLIKSNTLLNSVTTIQHSIKNESAQASVNTSAHAIQNLTQLKTSLSQLQQIMSATGFSQTSLQKNAFDVISNVQSSVQTLLKNSHALTPIQLTPLNTMTKTVLALVENVSNAFNTSNRSDKAQIKQTLQDNALGQIIHQLSHALKPLNTIIGNTLHSPANTAIMQLLGMTLHGQRLDQESLQKHTQQQLKTLLDQVSAKLQINQLRHLGLDTPSKEQPNTVIQHVQGEIPLRFNEQILPLTYSIQGFTEKETEQDSNTKTEDKKEKVRRWQIFMSLDLPDNEILHCKLTLINDCINTTLWAESTTLCEKTQQALSILEDSFIEAGLTVETVQCFQGKPPQDDTSLSYNLVDITT